MPPVLRFSAVNTFLLLLTIGTLLAQSSSQLLLKTSVDKERIEIGNSLIVRVILTNTAPTPLTAVKVDCQLSAELSFQPGSVTASVGTLVTASPASSTGPTGTWNLTRVEPGQSVTLAFRAIATAVGVVYHTAQVQGITARTCATVPVFVCSGDEYAFEITASDNQGNYGWERTFGGSTSLIPNQREKTLVVSTPGEYRAVLVAGQPCADGACCPFVIEPVADVPVSNFTGTSPTCSGTVASANGSIRLSGPASTTGLTFQLVLGGVSFETGSLLTPNPQPIPATGLLAISLTAGTYRVRVYNAAGCFRDGIATIASANCDCPPAKCVPFVIRQTKRAERPASAY